MSRLQQPRHADNTQTAVAYELMRSYGQEIRDVEARKGTVTTILYKAGVPVKSIAQHFGYSEQTIRNILNRSKPQTCHPPLSPGDACTACGTVEVAE